MKRAGTLREVLLDEKGLAAVLNRIASEIVEQSQGAGIALVGIQTGGAVLARRLQAQIAEISGGQPNLGTIDITLYRDDLAQATHFPSIKATDVRFNVDGAEIVLVDDVLYTGRTIRAALDALMDLGRPRAVRLAVLMDRGGRELPIAADFLGKQTLALPKQSVTVQLKETDGIDQVILEDLP
jgi:pyrimidine operon attenuation protein/uracil phosphoribosyltransferase